MVAEAAAEGVEPPLKVPPGSEGVGERVSLLDRLARKEGETMPVLVSVGSAAERDTVGDGSRGVGVEWGGEGVPATETEALAVLQTVPFGVREGKCTEGEGETEPV